MGRPLGWGWAAGSVLTAFALALSAGAAEKGPVTLAHKAAVRHAEFDRDGARVLTLCDDGAARVWDAKTGKCLRAIESPQVDALFGSPLAAARLAPDGKHVLTLNLDLHTTDPDAWPGSGGGSRAGPKGLVGPEDAARLWDADTGKEVAVWRPPVAARVAIHTPIRQAFSRDGKRVATSFGRHDWPVVTVRSVATGKEVCELKGHELAVVAIAFSPDATRVATASLDGTAAVWDAATGKLLRRLDGHKGAVVGVSFSPDGKRLLTTGSGSVHHYDSGPKGSSSGSSISAFTMERAFARVWEVESGKEIQQLSWGGPPGRGGFRLRLGPVEFSGGWNTGDEEKGFVRYAEFAPDGKRVVVAGKISSRNDSRAIPHRGCRDRFPSVWDVTTAERVTQFAKEDAEDMVAAALGPDGTTFATATATGPIRVWDVATGKERLALVGHTKPARALAFSPDGATLLSASADGTARLWAVSNTVPK